MLSFFLVAKYIELYNTWTARDYQDLIQIYSKFLSRNCEIYTDLWKIFYLINCIAIFLFYKK